MAKVPKANERCKTCRNITFLGHLCPEKIARLSPVFKGWIS